MWRIDHSNELPPGLGTIIYHAVTSSSFGFGDSANEQANKRGGAVPSPADAIDLKLSKGPAVIHSQTVAHAHAHTLFSCNRV